MHTHSHILYLKQTPVHCACELVSKSEKYKEVLKLLLCRGGDLYQRDNVGVTPLKLLQLANTSLNTTIIEDVCGKLATC